MINELREEKGFQKESFFLFPVRAKFRILYGQKHFLLYNG